MQILCRFMILSAVVVSINLLSLSAFQKKVSCSARSARVKIFDRPFPPSVRLVGDHPVMRAGRVVGAVAEGSE